MSLPVNMNLLFSFLMEWIMSKDEFFISRVWTKIQVNNARSCPNQLNVPHYRHDSFPIIGLFILWTIWEGPVSIWKVLYEMSYSNKFQVVFNIFDKCWINACFIAYRTHGCCLRLNLCMLLSSLAVYTQIWTGCRYIQLYLLPLLFFVPSLDF